MDHMLPRWDAFAGFLTDGRAQPAYAVSRSRHATIPEFFDQRWRVTKKGCFSAMRPAKRCPAKPAAAPPWPASRAKATTTVTDSGSLALYAFSSHGGALTCCERQQGAIMREFIPRPAMAGIVGMLMTDPFFGALAGVFPAACVSARFRDPSTVNGVNSLTR